MDPIEKLLSDLAPTCAPDNLDQTMARLFTRADRKARLRRAARSIAAASFTLAIGLIAGYQVGLGSVAPAPLPTITYVVPMDSGAFIPDRDSSASTARAIEPRQRVRSGSIAVTILRKDTI